MNSELASYIWLLCFISIFILFFGLSPFNFYPVNNVHGIDQKDGIAIFDTGSIKSVTPLSGFSDDIIENCKITIELWIKPIEFPHNFVGYILSFYDGHDKNKLIVGQWRDCLAFEDKVTYNNKNSKKNRVKIKNGIENIFSKKRDIFLFITSDKDNTNIYVNSEKYFLIKNFSILNDDINKIKYIMIGNSAKGENQWIGELYGVAIFKDALKEQILSRHYKLWKENKGHISNENELICLYLFENTFGGIIKDHSHNKNDLIIPNNYRPIKFNLLSLPHSFKDEVLYNLKDITINIIGFIPFGFIVSLIISKMNLKSNFISLVMVLIAGFIFSLSIEILQVFLPNRHSSFLDILCNTSGAGIGYIIFTSIFPSNTIIVKLT